MINYKTIATKFVQGYGVADVCKLYNIPSTTVEHALRCGLKRDMYAAPEQITIDNKEQMTIAEVYGEVDIK